MKKSLQEKLSAFLKGWGYSILLAVVLATSFKSAIADWNDIPSGSMQPTLMIGDRVFVNKLAYDLKVPYTTWAITTWAEPKRGEIVVFYSPKDGKRLIKRVVGLPGDTLTMRKNQLKINGQAIEYEPMEKGISDPIEAELVEAELGDHYLYFNEFLTGRPHSVMFSPLRPSLQTFGPVTIPEGSYFMMGDNRDDSADSRFWGFVKRRLIVGRAEMVVISRNGSFLHPRWHRFFKDLL
jgi:signal peptidase I